jgi:hypothetical protein
MYKQHLLYQLCDSGYSARLHNCFVLSRRLKGRPPRARLDLVEVELSLHVEENVGFAAGNRLEVRFAYSTVVKMIPGLEKNDEVR